MSGLFKPLMVDNTRYNPLSIPQYATVRDNNDPEHLQRIRCVIPGIIEGDNVEDLPWIFPQTFSGLGGRKDSSLFIIPEVGSEVVVYWPNHNDIYHCYYYARHPSKVTSPQNPFLEDYPETYGWIDKVVEWLRVNKKSPFVEFFRKDQSWIKLENDGSLHINLPKDLIITIGGMLQADVKGQTSLNTAAEKVNVAGATDISTGSIKLSSGETGVTCSHGSISGSALALIGSTIGMAGMVYQNSGNASPANPPSVNMPSLAEHNQKLNHAKELTPKSEG